MNAILYAALETKIDEWMNENAGEKDWPDIYVGDRTVEFMAKAARVVFDACEESQAKLSRES